MSLAGTQYESGKVVCSENQPPTSPITSTEACTSTFSSRPWPSSSRNLSSTDFLLSLRFPIVSRHGCCKTPCLTRSRRRFPHWHHKVCIVFRPGLWMISSTAFYTAQRTIRGVFIRWQQYLDTSIANFSKLNDTPTVHRLRLYYHMDWQDVEVKGCIRSDRTSKKTPLRTIAPTPSTSVQNNLRYDEG